MLSIRFTKPYKINRSPVNVRFFIEPIFLKFNTQYKLNQSPITIRFGDDTGQVDPTLPILQANIGIEVDSNWFNEQLLSNTGLLQWKTGSVKSEFITAFKQSEIMSEQSTIDWYKTALVVAAKAIKWGNAGYVMNVIQMPYIITMAIEYNEKDFNWLTQLDVEHTEYNQHWDSSEVLTTSRDQHWHVKPILESIELVIHYGETDKQYICYWRNHPFKGYVNLEFSEPAQMHNGRLVMRFNNPDKVCYWGLPGGLVRGDDDVPTIDRKIPIEPQIRNTYIMQPTIDCVRVSDDLKILISSVSYSISRGQFSATCNIKFCSRIDFDRALGQELKISINGYDFYVICEQPSTSSSFANSGYSASCRSRFALLSAPYARATN